jgi:hypothetical protein
MVALLLQLLATELPKQGIRQRNLTPFLLTYKTTLLVKQLLHMNCHKLLQESVCILQKQRQFRHRTGVSKAHSLDPEMTPVI